MLILPLIIAIVGTVACGIVAGKTDDYGWYFCTTIFCVFGFVALIVFGATLAGYIDDNYADERIEIVKTKNAEIEQEIQIAVKSYLEHEGKTYADMTPDEALAYAVAYPELASNELVKEQIATYKSNREQVLQYEQRKIDKKVKAWWLWFGSE